MDILILKKNWSMILKIFTTMRRHCQMMVDDRRTAADVKNLQKKKIDDPREMPKLASDYASKKERMNKKFTTSFREARKALNEFDQKISDSPAKALPTNAFVQGVPPNLLDKISEEFNYLCTEYNYTTGELFVIKVFNAGLRSVGNEISFQFWSFAKENYEFMSSGGSSKITTFEHGEQVTRDVQPDAILDVRQNNVSQHRIVVEADDGNRSFDKLDARMRYMMTGWVGCLIGIGFQFYPRSGNSSLFRAIAFLYYKRNNAIVLDRVLDIGPEPLQNTQIASIRSKYGIEVTAPENHSRCRIVPNKFNAARADLITNDLTFYQVKLDMNLLYAGVSATVERRDLVIDFFRVVERLTLQSAAYFD